MTDQRILNLAKVMVRYSIRVGKGDTVAVNAGVSAEPLVVAVYDELLRVGAFPVVRMAPDCLSERFFMKGQPHHFTTITPYHRAAARNIDAIISIYAEANTRAMSGVKPEKQTTFARTMKPLGDIRRKKPWLLTLFPTHAYAQDAEMSLEDFENFVYGATFADEKNPIGAWKALSRKQAKLIARLKGADDIRIVGAETDIRLSVKGRDFKNSDGSEHNMPSGEIYAAPVETSAEGYIKYDFPVCQYGREITGIRLVFRKGKVVDASADKNEKFLLAMLDADAGARRLGEIGIGTNMRIQRFVKRILFDEKIGGTIHLAVGNSIEGTGGKNKSAIHWDMIKDLRKSGALYVDGKLFQKNGAFV
ncbi:MAG: aminopeptidase [Kiritimatiellae bacterium]|nr:aminopeptidase [Kiritimatiellia bacterium]